MRAYGRRSLAADMAAAVAAGVSFRSAWLDRPRVRRGVDAAVLLELAVRGGTGSRIAAGCGYLLFALAPMWWTPWSGHSSQFGFHGLLTLIANCFLIAGLAFIACMAVRTYLPRSAEPVELCPDPRVPVLDRAPV